MEKNSPELWDKVWQYSSFSEEDVYNLEKEAKSIRWKRIKDIVKKEFGSFEGLKTIEIGAGLGTYSALMAREGADVTVFDYSDIALERAKEFFEKNGLKATFVKGNALDLDPEFIGKYDLSMSFGLTEHFLAEQRFVMNRVHLDVLRDGGITFISVPNKYNLPYRLFKFFAQKAGIWKVGEEYPYSRKELKIFCRKAGVSRYWFIGDSLGASFHFINVFRIFRKIYRKIFKIKRNLDPKSIRQEKGSPLDQYLSYALVLVAKK